MCDDSSIFENSNKRHPCEWRRRVNGGGCKVGWQGVALCMCEPAAPTTTHNRCVYENSKTQNLLTLTARCVCVCAKRRRDACTTQWFHLGREKSAHTHTHYTTDPGKPQLFAHFCVMPTHAHTHTAYLSRGTVIFAFAYCFTTRLARPLCTGFGYKERHLSPWHSNATPPFPVHTNQCFP